MQGPEFCGQFSCHSLQSSDLILAASKFSISSVGEGGSKGQEREREDTERKGPLLEHSYLCECLPRQQDWVWWHELEGQWGAVQKCLNILCSQSLGKKATSRCEWAFFQPSSPLSIPDYMAWRCLHPFAWLSNCNICLGVKILDPTTKALQVCWFWIKVEFNFRNMVKKDRTNPGCTLRKRLGMNCKSLGLWCTSCMTCTQWSSLFLCLKAKTRLKIFRD